MVIKVGSKVRITSGPNEECCGIVRHVVEVACKKPYIVTYKNPTGLEVTKGFTTLDLKCLDKPISEFDESLDSSE